MNTDKRRQSASVLVSVLGLAVLSISGCMVGPNYIPPRTTAPAEWAGVAKAPTGQPFVATAGEADLTQWWRQFNDPTMTALVEEAVKANFDLKIAEARLRQARASRGVAVGGLWPSASASGGYQRLHKAGTSGDQDLFQAGLDAVWELDLFGGLRRNVESADAGIEAAMEGIRDAQVSLVAEVALNYVQLRGYQQEIIVAQNNLEAQQRTAEITRKQFNVGFTSALDVANADSTVATTEAQIPVYETAARQAIYALSVLLARPPADLLKQLSPHGSLPTVPTEVPAGLPSDLLRRRPDIRESEAQLHAATAQIGVAVADLFPVFSLTGTVNWNSNLLRTWWSEASRSFGVGPSVTWPIFQGGAIESNVRFQEALRDQAFITYRKTVLSALQDVENALIAFANEQRHRKALDDAVAANRKAVDLSLQLYTEGQTDFLNVASAQRALYATEDALVQSNRNIATDLIALYKALGGGGEPLQSRSPDPKDGASGITTAKSHFKETAEERLTNNSERQINAIK
ncbi:MAG: efflux transporter outer membrane subunit [Geobacteraceae bacterium]